METNTTTKKVKNLINEIGRFQDVESQYEQTEYVAKEILNKNSYDYFVSLENIVQAYIYAGIDKFNAQQLAKEIFTDFGSNGENIQGNEVSLGTALDYATGLGPNEQKKFQYMLKHICFNFYEEKLFKLAEEEQDNTNTNDFL